MEKFGEFQLRLVRASPKKVEFEVEWPDHKSTSRADFDEDMYLTFTPTQMGSISTKNGAGLLARLRGLVSVLEERVEGHASR